MLTLDLFGRRGPFWEAVDWLRRRWSIRAHPGLPDWPDGGEVEERHIVAWMPSPWPDRLIPQAAPVLSGERCPEPWIASEKPGGEGAPAESSRPSKAQWWADLNWLHDLFVPASCTVEDGSALLLWGPFLSRCVLYEPPPSDLVAFAEMGPVGPLAVASHGSADPGDTARLGMVAPPVVWVEDADARMLAVCAWYDALIRRAGAEPELREHGIDLEAIVARVGGHPDLQLEDWVRRSALRGRSYIKVDQETTDADVRHAARLLKGRLPEPPKPPKPPRRLTRNPLVCVQCAVWYDECGWSHKRIGEHFGWAIQHPAGAKPRCETAREHIAEGRAILQQNKHAA
ncbi:MAG: hypothetical protein M3Q10_04275 [Chloroflexota bacterium]|nr:hypothetical protein [Chloroflexota bacterium]